jgi:hypothetical protein
MDQHLQNFIEKNRVAKVKNDRQNKSETVKIVKKLDTI